MSGNVNMIKNLLLSLGFNIDEAGSNGFETVLKGVTANLLKVGATVEEAAHSIVGFTTQIADGLEKVYWTSQRMGVSVQGIKALDYAASQTGVSAESAMSSLEGLASFMSSNPGAEGFLNLLGVQIHDASGRMRDTTAIFTDVGQKLSSMPHDRAQQYAEFLGIDEDTLLAMRHGMSGFTADYQEMLQKTGFNADKAAVQSNKFMTSMRGLTSLFGIIQDKVGSNLAAGLAGPLDDLRRRILDNFPKIEAILTTLTKGALVFAEAFFRIVYRLGQGAGAVIDWWQRLDDGSKNLLKIFGALLVGWRLLNSAFLSSPIGWITLLIIALGLLWEDYLTWKEGGNSLIDWSKWEPGINYVLNAFKKISTAFSELWTSTKELGESLGKLWDKLELGKAWDELERLVKKFGEFIGLDFSKFSAKSIFDSITNSIINSIKGLSHLVDAMKKLIDGDFSGAFESLKLGVRTSLDVQREIGVLRFFPEANNKLNHYLPAWLGGNEDNIWSSSEPGKTPQPTAEGADFLGSMQPMLTNLGLFYRLSTGQLGNDVYNPIKASLDLNRYLPTWLGGGENNVWSSPEPGKVPQPALKGKALLDSMRPLFTQLEQLYQLPEGLLRSVALVESGGNQFAVGPRTKYGQAKGLFQFIEMTARDMGLLGNDVFDPEKSAMAAAKYLSLLMDMNGGDLDKTLASYNWGIGNVQRRGMALMPEETRNYIPRVRRNMPGAGGNSLNQQTVINISGVSDPVRAGMEVADRQSGVNANLAQQIQTGPK